jgi:superfamily I DNA and/or RNA helicase
MDEREITMARVGHHSEDPVVQQYYQSVDPARADIVGATTSAAAELDVDEFDLVIVDEATQADQPATFIPLLRGEKLVLAGDHKQLPPFCSDETAREEDMHISLFEHFQRVYGEQVSTRLIRQYRMHEDIAAFPSAQFYDGQLEHGDDNRRWQINDLKPMVGHHIQSTEQIRDETKSRYNPDEAELVAQQARLLQMHGVDSSDIGIITAYSAQISEIADALRNEDIEDPDRIEIDTIDSFQGAEREAIIVSFVRSNEAHASGFLAFPDEGKRRLNVALTRAKKRLVVIGDFGTLGATSEHRTEDESCAHIYRALYDHLRDRNCLKSHT